jgi:hypothetical protein
MADPISQAIAAFAQYVGTVAFSTASAAGLSVTAAATVANIAVAVAYAAAVVAVGAGLNAALSPNVPSADYGKRTFNQAIPPRTFGFGTCRRSGPSMLYESSGTIFHQVVALNSRRVFGFGQVWLNDDRVYMVGNVVQGLADGSYGPPSVKIDFREGATPDTAFAMPIADLPFGIWTADHRGDGIAKLNMRCEHGKQKYIAQNFPNLIPQPSVETLHRAFDWRDEAQDPDDEASWGYSANNVVVLVHVLRMIGGHDWTAKFLPNIASLTAEADYCDELVLKKDESTEPRYSCGGFFDMTNAPSDVYARLIATFDGFMTQRADGAFSILAGRYIEPTVTLDKRHVVRRSMTTFIEADREVSELIPSFTSVSHDYTEVSTTRWPNSDAIARGIDRPQGYSVPWCQSNSQVRRLAKRAMARIAATHRGTMTCNMGGLEVLGQRYVRVQLDGSAVLADAVIEITGDLEIDLANLTVTFPWVLADENIDAWNPATEEGDGPDTGDGRVTGEALAQPVIDEAVAFFASSGTGGEGVALRVSVVPPARTDLVWYARWKEAAGTSWRESQYSDVDPSDGIVLETALGVPAEDMVDVAVAYQTGGGTLSEWSDSVTVSTSTAALAPAAPSGFGVTPGAAHAVAAWVNPPSANFVGARVWRGTTTLAAATDVSGLRSAGLGAADSYDDTGVAAGIWKYWVTAENATGVKTAAGPITVTVT